MDPEIRRKGERERERSLISGTFISPNHYLCEDVVKKISLFDDYVIRLDLDIIDYVIWSRYRRGCEIGWTLFVPGCQSVDV